MDFVTHAPTHRRRTRPARPDLAALGRLVPVLATAVMLTGCSSPPSAWTGAGPATRTPGRGAPDPAGWATGEAAYPQLDRQAAIAPPRFGESRTWPADPEDPAAGGQPATQPDSFAQVASLWGDWGAYYDGPAFGRERFDGAATLTMVTASEVGYTISPHISRDGRSLVFASDEFGQSSDIFVRQVNGVTKTRITHDAAVDIMPVFSPDGKEIAYASNREGSFDIYVIPADGGAPTRLTHHPDDALHPTFSPDGRRVAYCRLSSRTNRWEIWMTDRDTGQEKLLHYGMFPEWNPDPSRPSIVFQQGRERSQRFFGIWTIDLVDGEASAPTDIASAANYACMHPTWSPDGSRIAFVAVPEQELGGDGRPGLADIWIIGADGRERRQLTQSGSFNMQPAWSRDGTIFFTSDRSGIDNIWALRDPDTVAPAGTRQQVTSVEANAAGGESTP